MFERMLKYFEQRPVRKKRERKMQNFMVLFLMVLILFEKFENKFFGQKNFFGLKIFFGYILDTFSDSRDLVSQYHKLRKLKFANHLSKMSVQGTNVPGRLRSELYSLGVKSISLYYLIYYFLFQLQTDLEQTNFRL